MGWQAALGKSLAMIAVPLLALALVQPNAEASQEQVLPLSNFSFDSAGSGGSGPVSVTGTQGKEGIQSLSVKAFGREFKLTAADLAGLKTLAPFNGMQISYEPGFGYFKGRCLYLIIWSGSQRRHWNARLLTVRELGGVSISEVSMPDQAGAEATSVRKETGADLKQPPQPRPSDGKASSDGTSRSDAKSKTER